MISRRLLVFLSLSGGILLLTSFLFGTKTWVVDSKSAKIHFEVPARHHNGDFSGLTCELRFDPLAPADAYINATVDVATLTTDKKMLTKHLLMKEYFDASHHPKISFVSDSIVKHDSSFVAFGKLTMKNTIRSVQIPFRFTGEGTSANFYGTMEINAGDYGVGKNFGGKDKTLITIEVPVTMQ